MFEENNRTKDILVVSGIVIIALIIAFLMARLDVVRRAEHEYNEGEKFLSFYKNPDLKKQYYDEKLKKREITDAEYEMSMEDNALKNAYVEYQTVVDLFTPPESKWVKLSRQRLQEITPIYDAWVESLEKEMDGASGKQKKP